MLELGLPIYLGFFLKNIFLYIFLSIYLTVFRTTVLNVGNKIMIPVSVKTTCKHCNQTIGIKL